MESRSMFVRAAQWIFMSVLVFMLVPIALVVLVPSALVPIPPPLTCAVLLLGFAAALRLAEERLRQQARWGGGLALLGAVLIGILLYFTLSYCPGGR